MAADLKRAYLEMRRAGEEGFPPPCLDYLYRLIYRLSAGMQREKGFRQLSAAELCHAFQQQAAADFGALAAGVAETWGIASGADLGKAVFLLARFGCLALGEGETLEDYAAAGPLRFT